MIPGDFRGDPVPTSGAAGALAAWEAAQRLWDVHVTLSPPAELERKGKKGGDWGGNEPLAYIDLERRQVVVNYELLEKMGARSSLTAVLAHELGHHVRFPHTLGLVAQLCVLEQRLIPGLAQSLTNLFFDLQVNEVVGQTLAEDLCRVYRGFLRVAPSDDAEQPVSPLFWFYLAIYEELWGRPAGDLAPSSMDARMERDYPGCRADARMFAQTFWSLEDVYLQFVYFCSRFIRYLPDPATFSFRFPLSGDVANPNVDDWEGGLYTNDRIERAIEEGKERGWVTEGEGGTSDPLSSLDRISRHLPGHGQGDFVQTLVSRHYKKLVDRHLIELPPQETRPEAFLPTVTEEWEPGDNPREIDWTASVLERGALAAVSPLRRELEPDLPPPDAVECPSIEIYLDTSGSMPNPATSLNSMTLAAQILSAAAIRHKGRVRGVVYSTDYMVSPWMYDEETARQFLLRYAGGGTSYPWRLLKQHADERQDPIRVIITDSDFLSNLAEPRAHDVLAYATRRSRRMVPMLAMKPDWVQDPRKAFGPAWTDERFRVQYVPSLDDFAALAAGMAKALFGR